MERQHTNPELADLLRDRAEKTRSREFAEIDDQESREFWINVDLEAAAAIEETITEVDSNDVDDES